MTNNTPPIVIAVSSSVHYQKPLKVMLSSLFANNTRPIEIYFVGEKLPTKSWNKLEKFVSAYQNGSLYFIPCSVDSFQDASDFSRFGPCYNKIAMLFALPESVTKILWLDSDIIVNGNIEGIFDENIEDYSLAGCNHLVQCNPSHLHQLIDGTFEDYFLYFNAGVILFNVQRIKKTHSLSEFVAFFEKTKKQMKYADQDFFNCFFKTSKKVVYSPAHNYLVYPQYENDFETMSHMTILHFFGPMKPWTLKCGWSLPPYKFYWKYARHVFSPWRMIAVGLARKWHYLRVLAYSFRETTKRLRSK